MSYDIKFKQRAVEYQREGHTYKETCKVFKISETTLTRWINKRWNKSFIIKILKENVDEYKTFRRIT